MSEREEARKTASNLAPKAVREQMLRVIKDAELDAASMVRMSKENGALRARIAELEAALKPFAIAHSLGFRAIREGTAIVLENAYRVLNRTEVGEQSK